MLTTLLIILLLLAGLLAIPLGLSFQLGWRQSMQGEVRIRWAFGLVRFSLPIDSGRDEESPASPKPSTDKLPQAAPTINKKSRTTSGPRISLALIRRLLRFIRSIWHAIDKRDLTLHMRIGLGDPADTGRLWGACGPLSAWLADLRTARITLEPDFTDATFELDTHGTVQIIPGQILLLTLALLLSPSFIRAWTTSRA